MNVKNVGVIALIVMVGFAFLHIYRTYGYYVSPATQAAIDRLASKSDDSMHDMNMGMGMDMTMDTNMDVNLLTLGNPHMGHMSDTPRTPEEQKIFDTQWHEAELAVARLDTPEKALAAGYLPPQTAEARIMGHFVNWEQVEKPFDPARPSMILFATVHGKETLIGFSYFVRGELGHEPEGFAGDEDHWHRHDDACVINGQVGTETRETCKGQYINVYDYWMLHAWVVPELSNPQGRFYIDPPDEWIDEFRHLP